MYLQYIYKIGIEDHYIGFTLNIQNQKYLHTNNKQTNNKGKLKFL